jgi:hypothetical protein
MYPNISLEGEAMRVINEPIKVTAIFNMDGKIEPVKFVYEDQPVMIQKVLKSYEEKNAISNNLVFVCQHKCSAIYELKYEIKSNTWYMYKK